MRTRSISIVTLSASFGLLFMSNCTPSPFVQLGTEVGGAPANSDVDGYGGSNSSLATRVAAVGGASATISVGGAVTNAGGTPGSDAASSFGGAVTNAGGTPGSDAASSFGGAVTNAGGTPGSDAASSFGGAVTNAGGTPGSDAPPIVGGAAPGAGGTPSSTTGVTRVATGYYHTCAIKDGALYCWGRNLAGEIGDGTKIDRRTPTRVLGLAGSVQSVALGSRSTVATSNGNIYAWGAWYAHESPIPQLLAVATSPTDSLASASADEICYFASGSNPACQSQRTYDLGNLGQNVAAMSGMYRHFCAVASGAAYCWGEQYWGELGNGVTGHSEVATPVVGLGSGVTNISTGDYSSCAIKDGSAYCWGAKPVAGVAGQLVPAKVSGLPSPVSAISAGVGTACAIAGGALYCWGENGYGQVGNGSTSNTPVSVPVAVEGLPPPVTAVSVGGLYTCAIANAQLYCWGSNDYNVLGILSSSCGLGECRVTTPTRAVFPE